MARGRVLIIEDEPMIQMVLEDICAEAECDVVDIVDNVADALRAVERNDFNVTILDVNLQGDTSEPVALALKELGKPVLVATGSYAEELPVAYHGLTVVQKPFSPKEMIFLLNQSAF